MPKITKIESQKKRLGRYSVYVDGSYSFALSANDLLALRLYSGQEMTEQELDKVRQSAGGSRAYDQALMFINLRRRSEKEIVDYLRGKGEYGEEVVSSIIERLKSNGLINDAEFAYAWVSDRNLLKPRSQAMLRQELRQKGVSLDVIEQVLRQQGAEFELENVIKVAQKKLTRFPDQPKLIAYLMRQGFSYQVVKQALEQIGQPD